MEYTVEQIKEMNIYEKMSNTRLFMQEEGIKKLGKNTFAKYDYYKLTGEIDNIVSLYNEGKSTEFIGKTYNASDRAVVSWLKRENVNIRCVYGNFGMCCWNGGRIKTFYNVDFNEDNSGISIQMNTRKRKKGYLDITMRIGSGLDSPYYF